MYVLAAVYYALQRLLPHHGCRPVQLPSDAEKHVNLLSLWKFRKSRQHTKNAAQSTLSIQVMVVLLVVVSEVRAARMGTN